MKIPYDETITYINEITEKPLSNCTIYVEDKDLETVLANLISIYEPYCDITFLNIKIIEGNKLNIETYKDIKEF